MMDGRAFFEQGRLGRSLGLSLCVVVARRKTGFREAVRTVRKLERQAREQAWLNLLEGRL